MAADAAHFQFSKSNVMSINEFSWSSLCVEHENFFTASTLTSDFWIWTVRQSQVMALSMIHEMMRLRWIDFEILRSVVAFVMVNMMDYFTRLQPST